MPTYQYSCTECGNDLEVVQKFTDPSLTVCPNCEGELRKVFNAVGVVFKGSGFYRTDSRASDKAAAGARAKSESSASSGGSSGSTSGSSSDGTSGSGGTAEKSSGGSAEKSSTGTSEKKAAASSSTGSKAASS